jgi:hypothetical protein
VSSSISDREDSSVSKQALVNVIQRSISDPTFRRQLTTDASGALRGYDLTPDERSAMQSRDVTKLTAFGVDVRMSKAFSVFDPGATGAATLTAGGEPRDVAPVWIGDGSSQLPVHTYSGDDNAGPEGALANVTNDGYATDEGQLTNGNMGDAHIQISTGDGDLQQ